MVIRHSVPVGNQYLIPLLSVNWELPFGVMQDAIQIDEDLLANSARSLETLVCVGMSLGVSTRKQAEQVSLNLENCVLGA